MAEQELSCFCAPSLELATHEGDSTGLFFFHVSTPLVVSRTRAGATHAYQPLHALTTPLREQMDGMGAIAGAATPLALSLEWSIFYATMRQLATTAGAHHQAREAVLASARQYCPFPPLLAVLGDFFAAPSFESFLARPVWQLWLVQDYLFAVGRAMLPALVPDEVVLRRPNFVVCKLLYNGLTRGIEAGSGGSAVVGSASAPAPHPTPTAADSPAPAAASKGPKQLSMQEVAVLEEQLLGREELLAGFNVLPMEAFCPVTSTGLVLLSHSGVAFVANHAVSDGSESVLHGPNVTLPPANPNAKNGLLAPVIADTATLRDLDLAFHFAADQPDTRITQLDVVVVDCSGSMGARAFPDDADMSRSDAAQIMFNMAVDKYQSMEITARTACVLFGSDVQLACPFTDNLTEFETLLGRAEPMGQTRLWDALGLAIETLLAEHKRLAAGQLLHPECRKRILAMTDGLDNASTMRPVQVARYCRTHGVVLDAFVLGAIDDTDLRTVASATGGLTLAFRDMDDATELFERPYVVDVRKRPERPLPPIGPTRDSMRGFADLTQFPRVTSTTARDLVQAQRPPAQVVAPATVTPGATVGPTSGSAPALPVPSATTVTGLSSSSSAPATASPAFIRRVLSELRAIQTSGRAKGIIAYDASNMRNIKFVVQGAPSGVYASSFFLVEVQLAADYPFKAPHVDMRSTVYHPQVNTGNVCDAARSSWSPALSIVTSLEALRTMLDTPNADSAINTSAATMYRDNRTQYDLNVAALLPALTEAAARGTGTWTDCT